MRFHAWMIMHILNAQDMYLQREDDIMYKELSEVVLAFNASMLKLKSGYKWWEGARMPLNADFVEFMEGQIKDVNPVTDAFPWFSAVLDDVDQG